MITLEGLKKANEGIKTINIKGKEYAQVTERVKAFRELCPEGSITTEIVYFQDGEIITKTTVTNEEGEVLSTGLAHEKESSSFINKTSYVENCETSSVGRAMSWLNLGIDTSIVSADELVNAISNQDSNNLATESEKHVFMSLCKKLGLDYKQIGKQSGATSLSTMTKEQHAKALRILIENENNQQ